MPTLKKREFKISSLAKRYRRAVRRNEESMWNYKGKGPLSVSRRLTVCRNDWHVKQKFQYEFEDRIGRVFKWRPNSFDARAIKERRVIDKTEALRPEFNRFVEQWRKDTRFSSSAEEKILHPAYQSIIAMGKAAVPLVLEELQNGRGHLFWALRYMAGENPCPDADNANDAREAWLDWGRHKGFID